MDFILKDDLLNIPPRKCRREEERDGEEKRFDEHLAEVESRGSEWGEGVVC
jgi:hypothetical protein